MATSNAATVARYLASLPADRRRAISAVRDVILEHLPEGYEECMQYGMIGYVVPLSAYPAGYLDRTDQPLPYACLASQKNHMAVYLTNIYGDPDSRRWFEREYQASGKKMDMGKSCVRFRTLEDLPLDLIGKAVAKTPMKAFIARYEQGRAARAGGQKKQSARRRG